MEDTVIALLYALREVLSDCRRAVDAPYAVQALRILEQIEALSACIATLGDLVLPGNSVARLSLDRKSGALYESGLEIGRIKVTDGRVGESMLTFELVDYREVVRREKADARDDPGRQALSVLS